MRLGRDDGRNERTHAVSAEYDLCCIDIGLAAGPAEDRLGLFYLRADRHLRKISVAFTQSVKIKSDAGISRLHASSGEDLMQAHHPDFVYGKTMIKDYRRERSVSLRRAHGTPQQASFH